MKVILIDAVNDLYGSSKIARIIINLLRNKNVHVTHCVQNNFLNDEKVHECILPILVNSDLKKNFFLFTLNLFLKSILLFFYKKKIFEKYDIIYCNTFSTVYTGILLSFLFPKKKYILHMHETCESKLLRFVFNHLIIKRFNKILFVSKSQKISWTDINFTVIYNGIKSEFDNLELNKKRLYNIGYIGRLSEKKGINLFLNYIEQFNSSDDFVIAGGAVPGHINNYVQRIRNLKNVKYLGEINKTTNVMRNCDIFCLPSLYNDPFPTVVLEALSVGCIIVASDRGGAKEALYNTSNIIFSELTEEGLGAAITKAKKIVNDVHIKSSNVIRFKNNFEVKAFESEIFKYLFD